MKATMSLLRAKKKRKRVNTPTEIYTIVKFMVCILSWSLFLSFCRLHFLPWCFIIAGSSSPKWWWKVFEIYKIQCVCEVCAREWIYIFLFNFYNVILYLLNRCWCSYSRQWQRDDVVVIHFSYKFSTFFFVLRNAKMKEYANTMFACYLSSTVRTVCARRTPRKEH